MNIPPTVKQTFYASGALLNMMSLGMMFGYSAILTPAITDPTSDVKADGHTASWLASMSGISGLVPVLILGPIMHVYGRRAANICVTAPILLGWILTSVSYNLPLLFISRFLHCLSSGGAYFFAICIGEFSSPKSRGILLNLKILTVSMGIGLVHLFGYFLHWRPLALTACVPTGLALIITICWPDTPDWLVSRGRFEEAETVFFSLRGKSEESEREIRELINAEKIKRESDNKISIKKKLFSKVLWRPVVLLCGAILIPEFGGRHFFPSYSIELVKEISGDTSNGFVYTLIIDLISVISATVSNIFVRRYTRRKLLFYSGYSSAVILLTSCILMFVRKHYFQSSTLNWINMTLMGIYFFLVFSSTFAVSYILLGELFPLEYRALGTVLNGILSSFSITLVVRVTPLLKNSLDVYGMLSLFAVCMVLTLMYLQYDLPETQGRTLQDIGNYFSGKSPKVRRDKPENKDENKTMLKREIKQNI